MITPTQLSELQDTLVKEAKDLLKELAAKPSLSLNEMREKATLAAKRLDQAWVLHLIAIPAYFEDFMESRKAKEQS